MSAECVVEVEYQVFLWRDMLNWERVSCGMSKLLLNVLAMIVWAVVGVVWANALSWDVGLVVVICIVGFWVFWTAVRALLGPKSYAASGFSFMMAGVPFILVAIGLVVWLIRSLIR